jgi:hypothetical protein
MQRLLDDQPRTGRTHLSGVQEDGSQGEVQGGLEVGVCEDDVGILAAEFQCDPLHRRRGRGHHPGSRRDAPGERHQVDVRMFRQRRSGHRTRTEDQVGHTRRQRCLGQRPHQQRGGRRRELTGLEHDRVARQQCRGDLPDSLQDGVIPRCDQAANTDRLIHQTANGVWPAGVDHPARIGASDTGVVTQARQYVVDIVFGLDEPLSGVE